MHNTLNNTLIIPDNTFDNTFYYCRTCNKKFNNYQNRWKHEKICKEKNKTSLTTISQCSIINNTTNITTNTLNNNITNNIVINSFGKENLSHLTKRDIIEMLEQGFNCDLEYISKVHQNPKIPQNHNIVISNLRS
jgi:hypothetical protein